MNSIQLDDNHRRQHRNENKNVNFSCQIFLRIKIERLVDLIKENCIQIDSNQDQFLFHKLLLRCRALQNMLPSQLMLVVRISHQVHMQLERD